jgi:hypothetical protein
VAGSGPGSGKVARRDADTVGSAYRLDDYEGLSGHPKVGTDDLAKATVDEVGLDAVERRLGRADLRFTDNRGCTIP